MNSLLTVLAFMGIPTAITGFFFWLIQRKITKQEKIRSEAADKKEQERKQLEHEKEQRAVEREKHREKLLLLINQNLRAVTVLSVATANAVQRIPDAKCNGDMTRALKYVSDIQNQQKDFLVELGIHSMYD